MLWLLLCAGDLRSKVCLLCALSALNSDRSLVLWALDQVIRLCIALEARRSAKFLVSACLWRQSSSLRACEQVPREAAVFSAENCGRSRVQGGQFCSKGRRFLGAGGRAFACVILLAVLLFLRFSCSVSLSLWSWSCERLRVSD